MRETIKETLRKFYAFAVVCVFILATIGGAAYLFFYKEYLFGVVNLLLSAMAFPYAWKQAKNLLA